MFPLKLKLLSAVAVLSLSACFGHGTQPMLVSGRIPATEAVVKTGKADNNNTSLSVTVQHMATPEKVQRGATTYVVWALPLGSDMVQNLGALQVDKKLNGRIDTVLPFPSFKVFITAEPDSQVTEPTGRELLTANVRNRKAG